ncbi:MAG: 23S rRNA pseudouridine1911/1915/1917 synthase [Marivirga sp.]|jgi:23S rRNA pseudouridine1911/1915/1917 synthase
MREAVNQDIKSYQITEEEELLKYLIKTFPNKKRPILKSVLTGGQIKVNEESTTQYNHLLKKGDSLSINWSKPAKKVKLTKLNILYEDRDLIVIEKEAGLLSVASAKEKSNTAVQILKEHIEAKNPQDRVYIVHRIEREMSGILIFAKSKEVQTTLQEDWASYIKDRRYIAVAEGRFKDEKGTLKNYLVSNKNNMVFITKNPEGATSAITHYKVLKQNKVYSLLELTTETGFKNQIRVQLDAIGFPVTGDKKYGARKNPLNRVALHASLIEMTHPTTGKTLRFELVAPAAFRNLVATNA